MRKGYRDKLTVISIHVMGFLILMGGLANAGTIGVSFYGGIPWQHTSVAVSSNTVEYVDTEFDKVSEVLGGRLIYMLTDPDFVGVDLSIRKYQMDLIAGGDNWGTLGQTPVLVGLTFQQMPEQRGIAFHGGLGLGISLNNFDKTVYLDSLEIKNPNLDVEVKTSFAMDFDFGVGYFLVPQLSLDAGVQWLVNPAPVHGWLGEEHLYMQSTTFQFLASLTCWLR